MLADRISTAARSCAMLSAQSEALRASSIDMSFPEIPGQGGAAAIRLAALRLRRFNTALDARASPGAGEDEYAGFFRFPQPQALV